MDDIYVGIGNCDFCNHKDTMIVTIIDNRGQSYNICYLCVQDINAIASDVDLLSKDDEDNPLYNIGVNDG